MSLVEQVRLAPRVRAGFTGRSGGVSRPPWDCLDLALHVGDDPVDVASNRALVAAWAGAPLAFATQVHGAGVLVLDGPPAPGVTSVGEADALVTTSTEVALGVLVADCAPVLLADADAGIVAVAHAGRSGLLAGVLQATVATMVELGARRRHLAAAIGPCIAGASYEVPARMRDDVAARVPAAWATTAWGTPAVDLAAGVRAVLVGEQLAEVRSAGADTDLDRRLFSHRRDGPVTGRFAGVVRLLDEPEDAGA